MDSELAGADYRSFLNGETGREDSAPLQEEAPAPTPRERSHSEEGKKAVHSKKMSKRDELVFQLEQRTKKKKKETTDDFWNGGDGL